MPTDVVAEYYLGRELASVAMSHAAAEPGIRKIHLELARRYAELAFPRSRPALREQLCPATPQWRTTMTAESKREFHESRAIEEKFLAEQATDSVQSIPHDQLSKLHADKAQAIDAAPPLQETALDATAVDGNVIIVAAGEVNFLTPEAAFLTSDLLAARAREADRQGSPAKTADIETASDRSL